MGIKRILVVRNDRFGEFLLNTPAFRALKRNYPGAKLTLLVNPYVRELAGYIDCVDEVIAWENTKHKFSQIYRFSRNLKAGNFDLCVIFNPSRELNIIAFLAGIPIRVGYNRKWAFLLTHKMEDKKYLGQKHEVEYNLELLNLIGIKTEDKALSLKIDNGIIRGEDIALHPFTSDPVKQWPIQNFRELAQRLVKELNKKVIIVGGKEELTRGGAYFDNLGAGIVNMTGKTTLIQLASLLKKCGLLISGDSGPVHLACAVGTRVLALFRNDLPAKSAKRWGPWGEGHSVIEKPNLADISVDEVLGKVKEGLG
jgi:ADP-heptose:LPS heptosyltransferase